MAVTVSRDCPKLEAKELRQEAQRTLKFGAASALCAVLLLIHARSERYSAGMADYGFSPVFFPEILLFFWLGLSLLLAFKAWVEIRGSKPEVPNVLSEHSFRRPVMCFGVTTVYSVLILQIGFLFASMLFAIIFIRLFGYKKWAVAIPIAIVFPVVIWYVFNFSLHVPLPVSPWFSRI